MKIITLHKKTRPIKTLVRGSGQCCEELHRPAILKNVISRTRMHLADDALRDACE
jgi:hypothetical protein